ncbi:MAG: M81 family metallopeptidase [Thermomicrobiales bacterium]
MTVAATNKNGYRIGIGGIAIESSTFSPLPSTRDDFRVLREREMAERYPFLSDWQFGDRSDVSWHPCLHARSLPGGSVTAQTYAHLKYELLEQIRQALPLDGFYLDIHGAMHVQGMDDAEADLTSAIRSLVGPACLISAGMDLHGNVSARLVELVDLFTAHRHAPHIDAVETRQRACVNLLRCLDEGIRPLRAYAGIPIILPGERTSTLVEPGRGLYAGLTASNEAPGIIDASLWVGYVWADEPRSGASVVVTGTDPERIQREAMAIATRYWDARFAFDFSVPAGDAGWCITQSLAHGARPVLISDSGDNPTAGGAGDLPYMVERLLAREVVARGERTAIVASIADSAAVAACAGAGVGEQVDVTLGGKLDPIHAHPLPVTAIVKAMVRADPIGGDIAIVQSGGLQVILTSRRKPFHHRRDFTELGLDPDATDLVVVKIGYLEPELQEMARAAFIALTPGAVNQDIPSLTYRRVRRPIFPLDPKMAERSFEVHLFGA